MPNDAPLSRGKFLKSLSHSLTGAAFGTGMAAAQAVANKIAAVAGEAEAPTSGTTPPLEVKPAENPFVERGPETGMRFALTFDDGPNPDATPRILDELKARRVPATFFMIGDRVAAAPDLARRVRDEGHEIGNHTYTHPKLSEMSDADVTAELRKTHDIFTRELNHHATLFRPPYGAFRKNQAPLAQMEKLRTIFWNIDPSDWSSPGEDKIFEAIVPKAVPGTIVVCHDLPQTANCIGRVIDALAARGFTFVTVSSLLNSPE